MDGAGDLSARRALIAAMSWECAGYVAEFLLGAGSTGEVWGGHCHATGERVALKRLRAPAAVGAAALRREAALLAAVRSPYLLRVREVVDDGAGRPVLVLDHAAGGSLAALLAARGRLSVGEVVTVAVAIGRGLAAVHAAGLVHGDVAPGNVLFAADGRPLLADLGVSRLLGEAGPATGTPGYARPDVGASPSAAGDLAALAAVCVHALTGRAPWPETPDRTQVPAEPGAADPPDLSALAELAPARLVAAVTAALVGDSVETGTAEAGMVEAGMVEAGMVETGRAAGAAAFAAHVLAACPAEPVRLVAPAGPVDLPLTRAAPSPPQAAPSPDVPAGPRARARVVVPLVALTLGGVAVVALTWAHAGQPRARPLPPAARSDGATTAVDATAVGPGPDWRAVVQHLDDARAAAFASADPARLAAVYTADAAPRDADRATVERLVGLHARARGMHPRVVSVTVLDAGPDRARLRVVDVLPAYDVVDAGGRVLRHDPGRGPVAVGLTLARAGGAWLVDGLAAA